MTRKLARTDTITASDLMVLYADTDTEYQGAPIDVLVEFLNTALTEPLGKVTQQEAPALTGFNIILLDQPVWLILTPTATFANGAITLPTLPEDQREYLVTCTQIVTALAFTTNGANTVNLPTSLAAGDHFTIRFHSVTNTWYRVG